MNYQIEIELINYGKIEYQTDNPPDNKIFDSKALIIYGKNNTTIISTDKINRIVITPIS